MTSKVLVFATGALTAVNLAVLAANLSIRASASVGGMHRMELSADSDFRSAVQDVVEDCKVDRDKIQC